MKRWLAIVVLAACGGSEDNTPNTDGSVPGDAATNCTPFVTFDPPMPFAFPGSRTRAVANVQGVSGVLTYTWQVQRNGTTVAFDTAAPDLSAVEFDTAIADAYEATVSVSGAGQQCAIMSFPVNVLVPGANTTQVRLRVYPPASVAAPPNEKLVLVNGGANMSIGTVAIDPGTVVTASVGAQAYLRFMPLVARDAFVETFSSTTGQLAVRVINQPHDVLIVPAVAGFAPTLVTNWLPGSPLALATGTAITGVVRDPQNGVLAGAKVQMTIDGVPTTLATTDASGAFTIRTSTLTGAATIEVTPPAATGLPRLVATGAFDLAQAVQVKLAAGIVVRDLAGATVRRGGVAQGNATVAIVGTFASAGTVTTGATVVTATGEVRATATANGAGVLPALRAPDEQLSAVISMPSDVTMSAIDLRTAAPATVDAPAMTTRTVQLRNTQNAPLPGAVVEAIPKGTLAMSGVGIVRAIADANGNAMARLAPGATYDFHYVDPRGHESARLAGPRTEQDQTDLPATYVLPKALEMKGSLALAGSAQPIGAATIQVLCAVGGECTAATRAFPLAEGASSPAGAFAVAVTDPGTM